MAITIFSALRKSSSILNTKAIQVISLKKINRYEVHCSIWDTVCKVNVDRAPAIAEQYSVRAMPTVLIIKNGKEINRLVGLQSKARYVALLDKLANESKGEVSN